MAHKHQRLQQTKEDLRGTDSGPHPANFPVGSTQSRAAARMLAQQRETQRERLEVIIRGEDELHASPWVECADGKFMRTLSVPGNMSIEEARHRAGQ